MARPLTELSPVRQAEQALQIAGVLNRMEHRFRGGAWCRGLRVASDGSTSIVGAIDEATRWAMPGVAEEVTDRLAQHLPGSYGALGRWRPRLALTLYNDRAGRLGALALVRATRADFRGDPPPPAAPGQPQLRRTLWVD
jgi:hypothetical protein